MSQSPLGFRKSKTNVPTSQSSILVNSIRTLDLRLNAPLFRVQRLGADDVTPEKVLKLVRQESKTNGRARFRLHREENILFLPPCPPSPLFHTMFSNCGYERSMVFQYYVTEWWPHGRQPCISSAISGFIPILSPDHQVVNHRIQSALNYPSTPSIVAILPSSACRMQIVRNQPFSDPHLCEAFCIQAIRSLRARLGMDFPVVEQLILDISGLMYAEIFN